MCENFFAICERYEVNAYREYDTPKAFADFRENMLRRFREQTPIPDEFKHLDSNTWTDFQEFYFRTTSQNNGVTFVDDPAASNGRVVRKGNQFTWLTNTTIPLDANGTSLFDNADAGTKFKVVVYIRCDATANEGYALTCGVFDPKKGVNVVYQGLDISEIAGSEYKKVEFEPVSLNPSMYIWFAPPNREGDVQAVYIDRVLVIKEN
jgi:hypothetical protein